MSGYDSSRGRSEPSQPVASLQQRYRGSVPYAVDRDRERGWEAPSPVREAWRGERALSPPRSRSRDRPAYDRDRAPPYRSEVSYAPREPSRARPYRVDPYATAADAYAAAASTASARVNTHAELEHYSSRAGAAYARSQPSAHSRSLPRDPYPARGGGYEDGLYRVRDREPPAVASVRADSYASHRAAAPQQPRVYVDPYDAPRPLPAKHSSHGFAGDADGGAAKRISAAWEQREGRPAPVLRSVISAPRLSGNAFQRSKQLTDALGACASGQEVLALVASRLEPGTEPLGAYNITAALSRLSKLQPSGLAGNTRFAALLSATEALLDGMEPRSQANVLYACGKLKATLSDSWLARYWAASEGKLAFCDPQNLSNMIYAFAKLGASPPASWMDAFWPASLTQMGQFIPQGLSNVLWACGQLNLPTPADWLERFWEASKGKLDSFTEQHFSNTLNACGKLGITPPAGWMREVWRASLPKLGQFTTQSLANSLYACGQLALQPETDWLRRFWEASEGKLASFKEQELSNTFYACGKLGITPPAGWMREFWRASLPKLGQFKSQELSNSLYACGHLALQPETDWLRRFWEASEGKLHSFTEQHFSNTLNACGKLGITPPADWHERFWEASEGKLASFKSQELSNTLYASALLRIPPPTRWMRAFWRASLLKLGQFKSQELAMSLYACGVLILQPEPDWLHRFWEASVGKLHSFTPQHCANSLLAVAILQLWDCPVIRALWTKLVAAVASPSSPDRMLCAYQLYQVHLNAQTERPGLLPPPSAEALEYARDAWVKDVKSRSRKSELHRSVSACLTAAGIDHENEHWCEDSGHSIDITIESGSHRIALEVDGPFHYLQNGQPDGPTQLRDRTLRAHGWRVAVVDYRRWDALLSQHERITYLEGLLAAAAAPKA